MINAEKGSLWSRDNFHEIINFTPKLARNVDYFTPTSTHDQDIIKQIRYNQKLRKIRKFVNAHDQVTPGEFNKFYSKISPSLLLSAEGYEND